MTDEKRHKKEVSVLCCIYSGKETYKRTSLLYLHDSYPLSHEGIVVYSYEGTITPDLTIMMLYLVRTDVVATETWCRNTAFINIKSVPYGQKTGHSSLID